MDYTAFQSRIPGAIVEVHALMSQLAPDVADVSPEIQLDRCTSPIGV
jgi:hypothetical protein